MLLEMMGYFSLFLLALFVWAEYGKCIPAGVFASVLIMIFGAWIILDGIQIKTGEILNSQYVDTGTGNTTAITTGNQTDSTNSNNVVGFSSGSITYVYTEIPDTTFMLYQNFLGFMYIMVGMFAIWRYIGLMRE